MLLRRLPRFPAAVLVALTLSVTACGAERAVTRPPSTAPLRALDLDPEHYVRDYAETIEDMTAVPMVAPAGAVPATTTANATGTGQLGEWSEPGITDDNTFVDHGDSAWTRTTTDAESTFALDVDTGSYRTCQVFLDSGQRPPADAVRVEEWVNAFDYGDAPASDGLGLSIATGTAIGTTDGTQLVRVGVTTPQMTTQRPPANVTFVIDTSGSMDIRDRLGMVKASLALLVQHLADGDTLSIVEYGSEARVLLDPTPIGEVDRIVQVIDELHSDGSTNMEAGLRIGYAQARSMATPGELNVVVLASDGVANVGTTDASELTDTITKAGADGIHLVTVGFGMGNYNDDLMEQLADRGDGFYSYVDTFAEARRVFVDELTSTLTTAALDAKAQVRFDPEVVAEYRLLGYENRQMDDSTFDDAGVDAGELGFGHRATALYEVRLVPGAAADDGAGAHLTLGTAMLRWRSTTGDQRERSAPVTVTGVTTDSVRLAGLVAATAEVLRSSPVMTERGVTVASLIGEASELASRHVTGAAELLAVLRLVDVAAPSSPSS